MRAALAWVVVFAACAGGSGVARTPDDAVPPEGPAHVGVSLGAFEPLDVAVEADGTRLFARDGVRGILHADGRWEWASDITVASIRGAARAVGGGWLLLDADGALWRAPSFLGPLTFAGRADGGTRQSVRSPGRLALVDQGASPGDLHTIDAEGRLARVPGLPDASVISASFLDERTGAVVLDGGALYRTQDAGATWHTVEMEAVTDVEAEGEGWRASLEDRSGPGRSFLVSRSGAVGPPVERPAPDERDDAWTDDVALAAHLRLLNLAVPVLGGVGVLPAASRDPDRRRDVRLLSLETAEVETVRDARPAGDCPIVTWGAAVAALCRTDHGIALHRSTDGRRWTAVPGGPVPITDDSYDGVPVNLSADGLRAAWAGACHAQPTEAPAPGRTCLLTDARSGDRVELPLPLDDDSMIVDGPSGEWLLGETNDPEGDAAVWAFHVGRRERISIGTRAQGVSYRLTDDGLLVRTTATPNGASRVSMGSPDDATLRDVALPEGALTAGFADANHGVAAGATLSRLWRTLDGGRRWERLPVPVEGDASRVHALSQHDFDGVLCFAGRCVVARGASDVALVTARIVIDGWGPLVRSGRRLFVAPAPTGTPEPPAQPPRDELRAASLACSLAGTPPPRAQDRPRDPERAELPFGAGAAHGTVRIHAAGDVVSAVVDWSGSDARGRYHATSRASALASLDLDEIRAPDAFHVYSVTRAGVLFFLCGGGHCELLYAARGGPVRSLAHQTYESGISYEPFLARPEPDGGATLIGTEGRVSRLAPDGALTKLRRIATTSSRLGVGHDGTRSLVVAAPTYGLARFRAFGIDGPSMPQNLAATTSAAPCRAARRPGAIEVVMNGGAEIASQGWNVPTGLTTTLEVDPESACLRAVDLWSSEGGRDVRAAHLVAGADGSLAGPAWATSGREVPMRCTAAE